MLDAVAPRSGKVVCCPRAVKGARDGEQAHSRYERNTLCLLVPSIRQFKKVLLISFCMSLSIETMQAILDLLFNFDRVFEIDDLITNTVGGILAYLAYKLLRRATR